MSKSNSLSRKLGLGTVQFGADYGAVNKSGQVSSKQLKKILAIANRAGIKLFDTASGYDQSEAVLGRFLHSYDDARVVTKSPHFHSSNTTKSDVEFLRSTFERSLQRLEIDSAYGLLVHRGINLLRPASERLWDELESLKAQNKVQNIGVSVYTPEELDRVLDIFSIDLVQLPMNLLDQRFNKSGHLRQLNDAGIEVHVRSALLQGILVTEPSQLPDYFARLRPHLNAMRQQAAELGISMLAMALRYVLCFDEVGIVLVGVDSAAQLVENLQAVEHPIPTKWNPERWAIDDLCWIDPSVWQLG